MNTEMGKHEKVSDGGYDLSACNKRYNYQFVRRRDYA
jgi:hypothetical protein